MLSDSSRDRSPATAATLATLLTTHLAPYSGFLVVALLMLLLEMAAALALPWLAGRYVHVFADAGLTDDRAFLLGVAVVLLLAQFACAAAGRYVLGVTSVRIMVDLGRRVHEHLQVLPMAFHEARRSGDLLALLSHDVTALAHALSGPFVAVLPLVALLLGCGVMIVMAEPVFGLALVVVVPPLAIMVRAVGASAGPLAAAAADRQADSLAFANESLGLLRLIKTHSVEPERARRYRGQTDDVLAVRARQLRRQAVVGPVVYLFSGLVLLGLLWWGGERVRSGLMDISTFVSVGLYGLLMMRPLSSLGGIYLQFAQARGAAGRLLDVLGATPEPGYGVGGAIDTIHKSLTVDAVAFDYPGRSGLLKNVSFELAPGDVLALSGDNGAGKTTLVHLLLRFVSPLSGSVRIDGRRIDELNLHALRRLVGYVPQQALLANVSIRDNIVFFRRDVDQRAIAEAARLAGLDAVIDSLPDGYDTMVGDHGAKLSGGQRQRIALARALLGDPPLLVLDEATSQLARQAEEDFVDALRASLGGRIAIVISHRPALLSLASRTCRLEDGYLFEQPVGAT